MFSLGKSHTTAISLTITSITVFNPPAPIVSLGSNRYDAATYIADFGGEPKLCKSLADIKKACLHAIEIAEYDGYRGGKFNCTLSGKIGGEEINASFEHLADFISFLAEKSLIEDGDVEQLQPKMK